MTMTTYITAVQIVEEGIFDFSEYEIEANVSCMEPFLGGLKIGTTRDSSRISRLLHYRSDPSMIVPTYSTALTRHPRRVS